MTRYAILAGLSWALLTAEAAAALNVVATTPDLAALAREIGDVNLAIMTLAKPTEDPHFVDAKPSFIARLNKADLLIEGGAELESGWLNALMEGNRNPKIAARAPGRFVAAQGIALLDVPTQLDRSQGDLHALGNPHFLTDPDNARVVSQHLAAVLAQLDAAHAEIYQTNLARFLARLDAQCRQWKEQLRPFAGQAIVAYHNTWPYFVRRFGLKSDLFLEPKPGIPPSPAHLAEVIRRMKAERIRTIVVEPYQNRRTAEMVAKETGAQILDFTQYPGGVKGTEKGYCELIDYLVQTLAKALAATP